LELNETTPPSSIPLTSNPKKIPENIDPVNKNNSPAPKSSTETAPESTPWITSPSKISMTAVSRKLPDKKLKKPPKTQSKSTSQSSEITVNPLFKTKI
jgi:hypothetical protein